MTIELRKMRPADLPRVLRILAQWNIAPRAPGPDCPVPERSTLQLENTFVALAGDTVVGVASYILLGDARAETASLAVDRAWLGHGIGARLQRARLNELSSLGVRRVQTEADRPEVIEWYMRKFGYRVVGTALKRHPFSLAGVDRWTVLELDLVAEPSGGAL